MFKEKEMEQGSVSNNATILKEDTSFEGKLSFEGCVVVNGNFSGEVFSPGELVVGRSGKVEGSVEIGSITILGEVLGNIKANQKIVINSPAVVRGDIVAPSLIIEEGAVFEGNCSMGKNKLATATTTPSLRRDNIVEFQMAADNN